MCCDGFPSECQLNSRMRDSNTVIKRVTSSKTAEKIYFKYSFVRKNLTNSSMLIKLFRLIINFILKCSPKAASLKKLSFASLSRAISLIHKFYSGFGCQSGSGSQSSKAWFYLFVNSSRFVILLKIHDYLKYYADLPSAHYLGRSLEHFLHDRQSLNSFSRFMVITSFDVINANFLVTAFSSDVNFNLVLIVEVLLEDLLRISMKTTWRNATTNLFRFYKSFR